MQQPLPLLSAHPTHWRGTWTGNPSHLLGWAHLTFSRNLTRYVRYFFHFALFSSSQSRTVTSASSLACMCVSPPIVVLSWCFAGLQVRLRCDDTSASIGIVCPSSSHRWSSCLRRSEITYNNDPDVFNIFRSKELAKILRRTLHACCSCGVCVCVHVVSSYGVL